MSRFASVRTALPGPKSRSLLERKGQAVSSAIGIHLPAVVERAAGALLHDVDGNTFIDLSGGVGCPQLLEVDEVRVGAGAPSRGTAK